jgi:hypothetical protein
LRKRRNDAAGDGPLDFKDYGPQLSRNFRALKVWMTFKAYGARKLREAIESNIEIMQIWPTRSTGRRILFVSPQFRCRLCASSTAQS